MIDPSFLLDANICAYALGGTAPALRGRIEDFAPGEIVTSAVSFAEVMIDAVRSDKVEQAERFFRQIPVLPFDDAAARIYARLPFKRHSFDRLIAAHALATNLTIVTNNERHFVGIPGLRIENWTL